MSDILSLAQDLYDLARDDSKLVAEFKTERKSLITGIVNGTGVGDVVAGTKNGASYTKRVGFSIDDRIAALRYALQGIENGVRPGNVSRSFFI